jgi:hypothetical protein
LVGPDSAAVQRGAALRQGLIGPWIALREQVAASSDDAYEAARAVARRVRGRADTGQELRYALAFAFPSEPHWALADATDWLNKIQPATPIDSAGLCLLASLDDVETIGRFVSLVGEAPGHRAELRDLWLRYARTAAERIGAEPETPIGKLLL